MSFYRKTAGLVLPLAGVLLAGCGGGEVPPSPVTLVKTLHATSCSAFDPVAVEVRVLEAQPLSWLRRYCKRDTTVATLAVCGADLSFLSAIDVVPQEVSRALAIGYSVYVAEARYQDFDCE